MTWTDAEAYAQSIGGHLVTVNDVSEQDWLQQNFSRFGNLWIGLTDQVTEGTFLWSSGEAETYTNWADGQPDNYDEWWGGEADYTIFGTDGKWVDFRADHGFRGLIELEGPDSDGDLVPDLIDPYPSDPLNAWDLREAGDDSVFDTTDDVIYRFTMEPVYSTGASIGLFIQDSPLPSGHYRFTANGTMKDYAGNNLVIYQRTFDVALPLRLVFEGVNNNTLTTATPLTLTEDPAGSGYLLSSHGLGSIYPATYRDNWSDIDYWRFEALAGDVVSISVDTPNSDLDPYVELHDAADGVLASDDSAGPDGDSFISHYTIPNSGIYYVRVGKSYWASTPGSYELRVDLARGIQLESDASYSNGSISGANQNNAGR